MRPIIYPKGIIMLEALLALFMFLLVVFGIIAVIGGLISALGPFGIGIVIGVIWMYVRHRKNKKLDRELGLI